MFKRFYFLVLGGSISVFSQDSNICQESCSVGLEDGYKVIFFIYRPFDMVISPDLHPMKASVVTNHGLPRMTGWPTMLVLGWITRKSTGYSQEFKVTSISLRIPAGLILDLSTSLSTMGVAKRVFNCNVSMVIIVMIFIAAPKLIKVFSMGTSLMEMVTTRSLHTFSPMVSHTLARPLDLVLG